MDRRSLGKGFALSSSQEIAILSRRIAEDPETAVQRILELVAQSTSRPQATNYLERNMLERP